MSTSPSAAVDHRSDVLAHIEAIRKHMAAIVSTCYSDGAPERLVDAGYPFDASLEDVEADVSAWYEAVKGTR